MLNRIEAPVLQEIQNVQLKHPQEIVFQNGLKAFIFHAPDQGLIKAEFVFNNVFDTPENPVRNSALSAMLKEGTSKLTSAQIADQVDYYGAYLVPEVSFDHNALTLYTLSKHVDAVLPILHQVLADSIFPEQELQTYIRNHSQSLQISLEKNEFNARRMLYHELFGDSRYGLSVTEKLLQHLNSEDLYRLYQQQIQPQNTTLFLSGNITAETLALFQLYFENQWQSGEEVILDRPHFKTSLKSDLIYVEKPAALQSSIRLGSLAIQRNNPDYPALQFVNTLLGGYFGSRLMSNIREEKGYTYSIGSAVANLKHAGFMTIATDVGAEHTQDTLHQIKLEMTKLQQEKVSQTEIELVRNYMLGAMLGSLESIFSHVDKFKAIYFAGISLDYYAYYTQVLQEMNAVKIEEISQTYFNYDDMIKIVVGKMEK